MSRRKGDEGTICDCDAHRPLRRKGIGGTAQAVTDEESELEQNCFLCTLFSKGISSSTASGDPQSSQAHFGEPRAVPLPRWGRQSKQAQPPTSTADWDRAKEKRPPKRFECLPCVKGGGTAGGGGIVFAVFFNNHPPLRGAPFAQRGLSERGLVSSERQDPFDCAPPRDPSLRRATPIGVILDRRRSGFPEASLRALGVRDAVVGKDLARLRSRMTARGCSAQGDAGSGGFLRRTGGGVPSPTVGIASLFVL